LASFLHRPCFVIPRAMVRACADLDRQSGSQAKARETSLN
jgi:hypothetical protein